MDKVTCPYCGGIMTLCVDSYSDGADCAPRTEGQMDELISRDALQDALAKRVPYAVVTSDDAAFAYGLEAAYVAVQEAPTIDPVRHGYWKATFAGRAICSVCGEDQEIETFVGNAVQKYCARCGAHMDAEEEKDG